SPAAPARGTTDADCATDCASCDASATAASTGCGDTASATDRARGTGPSARTGSRDTAGAAGTRALTADLRRGPLVALLALAVAAGCRSVVPPDPARFESVAPHLGQLLLVGFRGTEMDADDDLQRLICRVRVGGILLFGRNVVEPSQVARLTGRAR